MVAGRILAAWLGLALTVCGPAQLASAQPTQAGDNVEAQAGDLRIVHFWSAKPEEVRAAFSQPTPPQLEMVNAAERNQKIQQFILYANCQRDPDGKCWLSAEVDITAPDGTPYGETLRFDALPLGPAVPRDRIGMAPGSIGLIIEDGEQLGRYRIKLAVTDEIAVQTATSVVHLDIVEAGTLPDTPVVRAAE